MRAFRLRILVGMTVALFVVAICTADDPGAKEAAAAPLEKEAKERRLEELLRTWDKKRAASRDFRFEFERTDHHRVKNEEAKTRGVAIGTMPGKLRVEELGSDGKPVGVIAFTDDELRCYSCALKQVFVLAEPVARRRAAVSDGKLWWFEKAPYWVEEACALPFHGLSAADLKARFNVSLLKEEGQYVVLRLVPRTDEVKCEYQEVSLVLDTKALIAWRTQTVEPNGDWHLWSLTKVETKDIGPVTQELLFKTPPGEGWKEYRHHPLREMLDEASKQGPNEP